jgi:hypothetical protein
VLLCVIFRVLSGLTLRVFSANRHITLASVRSLTDPRPRCLYCCTHRCHTKNYSQNPKP